MKERKLITVVFDEHSDLWNTDNHENIAVVEAAAKLLEGIVSGRGYLLYPELFVALGYNIDGDDWYKIFKRLGWAYKPKEDEDLELRCLMEADGRAGIEVVVKKEEE